MSEADDLLRLVQNIGSAVQAMRPHEKEGDTAKRLRLKVIEDLARHRKKASGLLQESRKRADAKPEEEPPSVDADQPTTRGATPHFANRK